MKKIKFVPVKTILLPVQKNQKSALEKKVGVKKVKNGVKSGREKEKVPVKKPGKWPKMAFTGTFEFTGMKKNIVHCHCSHASPKLLLIYLGI